MIDISSQDATESKLRALINLGNAFSWDTPDPAIRRGPDRGNASLEIYCENNRTNRVCLVAPLLLEFTRSVWGFSGERISQLSLRQNKNVTAKIGCRSLATEAQKARNGTRN